MSRDVAVPGDYNVIDDLTGFKIKASDSVLQWNGIRTHRSNADIRNPQDYVTRRREVTAVTDARPEDEDVAVGTVTPNDL